MRVGVVGIGGLGHLALQFARAMGCEVTAISSTPDKEAEAHSFGAHRFVATKEKGALRSAASSLDFVLSTVYATPDWEGLLAALRPNGTLCLVGGKPGAGKSTATSLAKWDALNRNLPSGMEFGVDDPRNFNANKQKAEPLARPDLSRGILT